MTSIHAILPGTFGSWWIFFLNPDRIHTLGGWDRPARNLRSTLAEKASRWIHENRSLVNQIAATLYFRFEGHGRLCLLDGRSKVRCVPMRRCGSAAAASRLISGTSFDTCRRLRSTRRAEISKVMRRSLHYRLRVLAASIEICRVACSQKCTVSAPYGSKLCETH